MFSCNYNGWADVPEDEREGLQAFEAAADSAKEPARPQVLPVRCSAGSTLPYRKAA